MLQKWLSYYGQTITEITEDDLEISDVEEDSENEAGADKFKIGTCNLSVKMELKRHIPELLPMAGFKVRVHYGGIRKQCLNCYGWDHVKKECKEQTSQWLEYVAGFIERHEKEGFTIDMYGKWFKQVRKRINETSDITPKEPEKKPEEQGTTLAEPNLTPSSPSISTTIEKAVSTAVADIAARLNALNTRKPPPTKTTKGGKFTNK